MPGRTKGTAVCACCGKLYPRSKLSGFQGVWFCSRCLDDETFVCSCCGQRVAYSENAAADGDGTEICQTCFDKHFTRCEACGLLLRQSDAHWRFVDGYERPYCDACIREKRDCPGKQTHS